MFSRMPERSVALTLLWVWMGIVVAVIVGWWLYKKFRAPEPPPPLPYAQDLKNRLHQGRRDKRTRRAGGNRPRHRK